MSFSINCLEITATKEQWRLSEKGLYKRLLSEEDYNEFEKGKIDPAEPFKKRFFFNDFYVHNQHGLLEKNNSDEKLNSDAFYGKNINIQAIVGKNGSGKSSLMDLMYVTINNFACFFTHRMPRSNLFARGVYVKIYFNINSLEYVLECKDVQIKMYSRRVVVGSPISYESNVEHFKQLDDNSAVRLAGMIFYTIVSNYAVLSLVPSNYGANCLELRKPKEKNQEWGVAKWAPGYWIQRIFHKNDGYTCPIVLNPMRDEGKIDVEKEMRLSRDRLLGLLIYAKKHGYSFDDRYELSKIEVCFKNGLALHALSEKWKKFKISDKDKTEEKVENKIIEIVDSWLINPNSVTRTILNMFKLNVSTDSPKVKKIALAYLQNKILSLPKYYSYKDFSEKGDYNLKNKDIDDVDTNFLKEMILKIFDDSSHIVTKIHQVVNFLKIEDDDELFNNGTFEIFSYEKYKDAILRCIDKNKDKWNKTITKYNWSYFNPPFVHAKPWNGDMINKSREFSLDEIIECLPPPVLDYRIFLYDKVAKKDILYNRMSSGELQLLQTISTHLYHVRNIMSVNGFRLQYKNINMVFDELEICFHPEYQRLFVKKLIDIITNLKLNETCSFNIFLITHSPFILSDIPSNRVLYLKNGTDLSTSHEKMQVDCLASNKETFGQNIGSLFCNSFFLEYYVGDFAKKKINEILDEFDKNKTMSKEEFERKIQIFGDSLLKHQMMNYYDLHKV